MIDKVDSLVKSMEQFYKILEKKPQDLFPDLIHPLQNEWVYITCINDHPEDTFPPLDHVLANSLNPDIFVVNQVQEELLQITLIPVRMEGLGILHPRHEALLKHVTSTVSTNHAVA